jgi:hypothetical protein
MRAWRSHNAKRRAEKVGAERKALMGAGQKEVGARPEYQAGADSCQSPNRHTPPEKNEKI